MANDYEGSENSEYESDISNSSSENSEASQFNASVSNTESVSFTTEESNYASSFEITEEMSKGINQFETVESISDNNSNSFQIEDSEYDSKISFDINENDASTSSDHEKHDFKDWVNPQNYDESGKYIGEGESWGYKPYLNGENVDTSVYNESIEERGAKVSAISEYMNSNNYGRDDFATYSQDPEWRSLIREVYPDYELPPVSEENARNNMIQYMSEKQYTPEDLATYSQDPKWQMLYKDLYHQDFQTDEALESKSGEEIEKVTSPDKIVSSVEKDDNNKEIEGFSKKSFDDKIASMTIPENLAVALKSESEHRNDGTGTAERLNRDQKIWNDSGITVVDENGYKTQPDGDEKTYEQAFRDVSRGAKGNGMEEAVAYSLRDGFENVNSQTRINLEDGTYTKSDLIAENAKEDMQIGSEYVKAGESIGIELKCGDERYLTSQIPHIDKQLSGYDEYSKTNPDTVLHRTVMVTADYNRMSEDAKQRLQSVAENHNASVSILPFYAIDMTYAHAKADVSNNETDNMKN